MKPTYHPDGTVTIFDIFRRTWLRRTSHLSMKVLASESGNKALDAHLKKHGWREEGCDCFGRPTRMVHPDHDA